MMKRFSPPKWLIWLSVNLGLLAFFFFGKYNTALMNGLSQAVTTPLGKVLGRISALSPVSLMETAYVTLAAVAMIAIPRFICILVANPQGRWRRVGQTVLTVGNIALSVYAAFWLVWGVQYYTDDFATRADINAAGGTTEELAYVTAYFVAQLQQTYDTVDRDEAGLFAVSRDEILADAPQVYNWVGAQYDFLNHQDVVPRAMAFSQLMSEMSFTGVYSPFTGEAHVNVASPTCLLPATIAHELGHLRGIAEEDACNFLGVLASTTSGIPAYVYAGYLSGYIYLSNALYARDYDVWYAIASQLPYEVTLDLQNNTAYWATYRTTTATTVSQATYDAFLKNYGQTDGMQSYGMAVDLLLAYYLPLLSQ